MLRSRGGTKACPISISDLVLLHNKASEGLVKTDRVGYDLYSGIADTKALFIKYCKQYERRIRTLVPVHRVVPAGDGEDSTTISVPGFVVDAKAPKKKTFAPQKVELQFLETHKKLFMELHQEFSKSDYAPQSEASLQNFQTLLILEISILLGTDIEWATGSTGGSDGADPPVLDTGAAADDGDGSISPVSDPASPSRRGVGQSAPPPPAAAAPVPAAAAAAAAPVPAAAAAAAAPASAAAAAVAADAAAYDTDEAGAAATDGDAGRNVLDVEEFTTWQPDTWHAVDFDKIPFPTDPLRSICSVRSYMAVAMILWHDPDLRAKHSCAWDGLTAAWRATFHHDLTARDLEKWPEDGPHGFNKSESAWLAGTLRFLKRGPGRAPSSRRRVEPPAPAPPPPQASIPAGSNSGKAQRRSVSTPKPRDPDPVRASSRLAYKIFIFYIIYNNYGAL